MTDTPNPDSKVPNVTATVQPIVLSESTKLVAIAGFAMLADHFMHSESAIMAVIAAGGAFVTGGWGLYRRVSTWRVLRHLATVVDDSVATVGKPQ